MSDATMNSIASSSDDKSPKVTGWQTVSKEEALAAAQERARQLHNELQSGESSFDFTDYKMTVGDQSSSQSDSSDLILRPIDNNVTLEDTATHW